MNAHRQTRILLIDNYDSYVYNLYQRIGELTGLRAIVRRNDQTSPEEIAELDPTHVVLSPGPGNPEDPSYFGICTYLIRELGPRVPLLGICLGHQGIGATFGGRVVRAPKVMHGKTSLIHHQGGPLFAGLPSPFVAMRYHSLMIDPSSLPSCLRVTARTEDGLIMGVEHTVHPIVGLQFHPESIGTPQGAQLLMNFLSMQGARQERAA